MEEVLLNSDQERRLFTQYSWEYDYIGRKWVAPNGRCITTDQLMEMMVTPEDDLSLMALIVENGVRQGA